MATATKDSAPPERREPLSCGCQFPFSEKYIGLRVVYDPLRGAPKGVTQINGRDVVDIVAIHGMAAHPRHTWCADAGDGRSVNWIEDQQMLRKRVPNARVLRFGYVSGATGANRALVRPSQICDKLLDGLCQERKGLVESHRPIIFIAHSYGGLVLMKTIIELNLYAEHKRLRDSITGMLFFGTPFRGTHEAYSHGSFIEHTSSIAEGVMHVDNYRIFEAGNSLLREDYDTFLRDHHVLLVTEEAACLGPGSGMRKYGRPRDHLKLNKFADSDEADFMYIMNRLEEMVEKGNEMIITRLENNSEEAQSIHGESCAALVGLGGVGKTQVALQFCYWVKANKPQYSIFWISALSGGAFDQSCLEIVRELGLPRVEGRDLDAKQQMKDFFSKDPKAGKWLLVLDNADEIGLLETTPNSAGLGSFLPHSDDGIILVTTKTEAAAVLFAPCDALIQLDMMDMPEARALLEKSMDTSRVADYDNSQSRRLLMALETLPLAITHAAAYLHQNRITIQEYLELLEGQEEEAVKLLSHEFSAIGQWHGQKKPYPAVMTTLLASLDQIGRRERHRRSTFVVEVLMFLSRIEPKAIPKSMLPIVGGSAECLTSTIGTLLQYAILTKGDGEFYHLHSLVHLAVRSWVSREALSNAAAGLALVHLGSLMPDNEPLKHTECMAIMPHALRTLANVENQEPDARFSLAAKVSWWLGEDGRYHEALKWAMVACNGVTNLYPRDSPASLTARYNLACARFKCGQWPSAAELLEPVVEGFEQAHSEDNGMLLLARAQLARTYAELGRAEESARLFESVAAVRRDTLPPGHLDRIAAEHDLAHLDLISGRLSRALESLTRIVPSMEEALPAEHSSVLKVQIDLAQAYLLGRRTREAVRILTHVCSVRGRTLPAEHPTHLASLQLLALAYLLDEQPSETIRILEPLLAVRSVTLPPHNSDRLSTQIYLGNAYIAADRVQEGLILLESVVHLARSSDLEQALRLYVIMSLKRAYEEAGDTGKVSELEAEMAAVRGCLRRFYSAAEKHQGRGNRPET
ncbi:hypothetical protein Micbo1qcDRAFT_212475 [Microdochium bolleyi]|uniref:NB-ARC domain-containing protein n=1 Tax=Microdochium bolleyi TaxID=196109 RepID=A0A136IYC0_9PEZI|nr:hypothetical protein Micbo1qcDRAFT_212475 [Microdochium bolleyi]